MVVVTAVTAAVVVVAVEVVVSLTLQSHSAVPVCTDLLPGYNSSNNAPLGRNRF